MDKLDKMDIVGFVAGAVVAGCIAFAATLESPTPGADDYFMEHCLEDGHSFEACEEALFGPRKIEWEI